MPKKNGEVNISGGVKAGGRIFTGDSVTYNGRQIGDKGIDLANASDELRIGMKLGKSITKGEITYVFVKQDSQTGEYIYKKSTEKTPVEKQDSMTTVASEPEVGSEEWLQQLNATIEEAEAKKKATLPTFDSLKATLPRGAITDPEIVGRFKQINGKLYRMYQPTTQTQEGYVYVPIA